MKEQIYSIIELCLLDSELQWRLNEAQLPQTWLIESGRVPRFLRFTWSSSVAVDGIVQRILVTISDETELKISQDAFKSQERHLVILSEMASQKPLHLKSFFAPYSKEIEEGKFLETNDIQAALKFLHRLKGDSRSLGFKTMAIEVHSIESEPKSVELILERCKCIFYEYRNIYTSILNQGHDTDMISVPEGDLRKALAENDPSAIRSYINKPALNFLADLSSTRALQKTAAEHSKEIKLVICDVGPHFIDIKHVSHFESILSLVFVNAIDHGIESPEIRRSLNKPEKGSLFLTLENQILYFEDDGHGLDIGKLRNLGGCTEEIPDSEVAMLIFQNGFSTCKAVT